MVTATRRRLSQYHSKQSVLQQRRHPRGGTSGTSGLSSSLRLLCRPQPLAAVRARSSRSSSAAAPPPRFVLVPAPLPHRAAAMADASRDKALAGRIRAGGSDTYDLAGYSPLQAADLMQAAFGAPIEASEMMKVTLAQAAWRKPRRPGSTVGRGVMCNTRVVVNATACTQERPGGAV